jgi:hypothetical protein
VDSVQTMVVGWVVRWAAHSDRTKAEKMAGDSAGMLAGTMAHGSVCYSAWATVDYWAVRSAGNSAEAMAHC